ncbi:MAG TPA: ATP-binding cassette domain-containing protein [Dongiaceae bacterium]|nr:ATP-binding cassette domain-containing protein [Dongiaceae bacterium]
MLDIDLTLPLDRFPLSIAWKTDERTLGVFGPSGSGKTSLLETIAGLRPEARGRIKVGGHTWLDTDRGIRLPPEKRGVGYVPQDARLFPHLDLERNVLIGRRRAAAGRGARINPERVLAVLELTDRDDAEVASLSGGERQRVALARALCAGPELLLLDEPLGGLDQPLRRRILPYLLKIDREFGVPSILVTHDAAEVRLLSREALVLIEGRAAARGRPDELFGERDVLERLGAEGHTNILRGRVAGISGAVLAVDVGAGQTVTAPAAGDLAIGDEAAVLVRAEELIIATASPHGLSAQNLLPGHVRAVIESRAGEEGSVAVTVVVPGTRAPLVAALTTHAARRLGLGPGSSIFLVWKTHACRAVPAGTAPFTESP